LCATIPGDGRDTGRNEAGWFTGARVGEGALAWARLARLRVGAGEPLA